MRQGLNPGHMKSGVNMEGTGQQQTDSSGTMDSRNGERTNATGGKFTGFYPEGPEWTTMPSARPDSEEPKSGGIPLVDDTWRWS